MKKHIFARKVTCNEKIFLALTDCRAHMIFRFLLHLDAKPSLDVLEEALRKALENCPDANLRFLRHAWYVAEYLPPIEFFESDSDSIEEHPISELDYRKNTMKMSVIHHKKTDGWYIALEFFHGACDGRSALNFTYDIFSAMSGAPMNHYVRGVTDAQLVKKYTDPRYAEPPKILQRCRMKNAPTGKQRQKELNVFSTDYRSGAIAAKLTYAVSQVYRPEKATVMIPVDLRGYMDEQEPFRFGNLVLPLFYRSGGKDLARISRQLRKKIKRGAALSPYGARNPALYLAPLWLVRTITKIYLNFLQKTDRYMFCSIVSYLGSVDPSRMTSPHVNATDMTFQATSVPLWGFGMLAAGLHYLLVTSVPNLHGGFCLYNGGFTACLICLILVPELEKFFHTKDDRRLARAAKKEAKAAK